MYWRMVGAVPQAPQSIARCDGESHGPVIGAMGHTARPSYDDELTVINGDVITPDTLGLVRHGSQH
jgi:hypothetical protein